MKKKQKREKSLIGRVYHVRDNSWSSEIQNPGYSPDLINKPLLITSLPYDKLVGINHLYITPFKRPMIRVISPITKKEYEVIFEESWLK